MHVRWFPQSFIHLRTERHEVCFDPALTGSLIDLLTAYLPARRERPLPPGVGTADLVLVSHHHADHLEPSVVRRLSREGTLVLAPAKCIEKLEGGGKTVAEGDIVQHLDLTVTAVAAYNPPGSRSMSYHKRGEGVGFVLEVDGRRIYHAGDTGLIDEMKTLGKVDIALLPIGGRFTMDIEEAVEAVKVIEPGVAIPMHMLRSDPQEFKRKVEEGTSTRVAVLAPGEGIEL